MPSGLKSELYVSILMRQANLDGGFATLVRRGDEDAGAILLKMNLLGRGFRVLNRIGGSDEPTWMSVTGPDPVAEGVADAYISRSLDRDSDLWVVEIETRVDGPPLGEKLVE